jgi:hypothetical protein
MELLKKWVVSGIRDKKIQKKNLSRNPDPEVAVKKASDPDPDPQH